jgi:hypothetical protein
MSDNSKITAAHLQRLALVYVRQFTTAQVEYNRESTERQYRLAERAAQLGWKHEQIKVLDQDLGISGSGLTERAGFTHMTAEVALRHVGIVTRVGSLTAGAQQRRLVSAARPLRHHRHPYRRCGWNL